LLNAQFYVREPEQRDSCVVTAEDQKFGRTYVRKWADEQAGIVNKRPDHRKLDDTGPTDISARGWKDILTAVYHSLSDHRVLAIAAGSAFYAILALSPALAAGVSLYGLFADSSKIATLLGNLSGFLPSSVLDIVRDQLQRLTEHSRSTLEFTFLFTLALSLWSVNAGTKALIDALNIVYGERERRSLVRLNLVALALTAGAIFFALIAVGITLVLPLALKFIGFGNMPCWILALAAAFRRRLLYTCRPVLLRNGPGAAEMEMGNRGQRRGIYLMADLVDPVLMVRRQLRQL
jgi:hypothetical protein